MGGSFGRMLGMDATCNLNIDVVTFWLCWSQAATTLDSWLERQAGIAQTRPAGRQAGRQAGNSP